ncbi:MAG: hypothetical protein H6R10_1368 [Rhodocyclaceae bacterium]|nr:hypothetical protein [Rhodocyclaceae bacterium]
MAVLSNPSEIARETLRLLAARRIPPTPDNYRILYGEISGNKTAASPFPEKHLRSLAADLPKAAPDQMRLARHLEEAVRNSNWDDYRNHLVEFITAQGDIQKLAWADLIGDLLRQWEAKQAGITPARKREALEHVLTGAGTNPDTLFHRLQNLLRSWAQGKEAEMALAGEAPMDSGTDEPATKATAAALSRASDLLPELRELFAYTLETAIATQLMESPQLSADAKHLAGEIRGAVSVDQLQDFLTRLKRFAFKLELLAEDQAELRRSLLQLLRLLVENITELVMDDRWLHGQIEVVREIIDTPLSQRAIDDAERRLKEIIYKQSQLKQSLQEAKEAIKHMLAGFVDHLAEFADATSGYHDKIEACASRISAANDITDLETVIGEVMHETRAIQLTALRSRDELRATQERVRESESRIRQLETELEQTSHLVRHDQLTGALNRRGLEETLGKEMARSLRHETELCVALLDLDNFKRLNDSLGHDAGDQALVHLARVCKETLRPQDTVARYGGEEFVILLPETRLEDAATALNRLQRELTRLIFLHDNQKVLITFSAGVTQVRAEDDQSAILKRADEAMYEAKKAGKNRVFSVT